MDLELIVTPRLHLIVKLKKY